VTGVSTAPVKKVRVLSGVRPTGGLHLGNLLGALEQWKDLQAKGNECFFMVADWHALTTQYESTTHIREQVRNVALDILAAGIDPKLSTVFIQSDVKEHAELALLLSMITPLAWLERNPTYKDQIQELKGTELHTHGFLGYPVLQAADIMLYKATGVPVGEDQLPHLEVTREIIRRFNHLYHKNVFPEPKALLSSVTKLPGLDGRKMSKSYDNCIYLSDNEKTLREKVMQMVTDPARKRRTDKGHPEVCPVFSYQKIFSPQEVPVIEKECREAVLGCVDDKKNLADRIVEKLKPIMEKRAEFSKDKRIVEDILREGAEKARRIAQATLEEAREAVGL